MKSQLRILHLEDDPRDAELVQDTLEADGISCSVQRVETEADFVVSLKTGEFDLILADYTLPLLRRHVGNAHRPAELATRAVHLCFRDIRRRNRD
jgi:CheY-like chemotaxis protein